MSAEYETITRNGRTRPAHDYLVEDVLGQPLAKNEIVHHNNGNKRDNSLENLEVMDRGEHTRMHKTGISPTPATLAKLSKSQAGRINPNRKLSPDMVVTIAESLIQGDAIAAISRETGVPVHTISAIRDGKRYRDCLPNLEDSAFPLQEKKRTERPPSTLRNLSPAEVSKIRIELIQGHSVRFIAKQAGVSESTVRAIKANETYQDIPWPMEIARYEQIRNVPKLARILLESPMSETADERKALLEDYHIVPDVLAVLMLKLVQRAMSGDAELAMLLLLLAGYENEISQIFLENSEILSALFSSEEILCSNDVKETPEDEI